MNAMPLDYDALERDFAAWAQAQPPIHAAVVIGSRARRDPPPDEWSDLDLIVFTSDMQKYAADNRWLASFGAIEIAVITPSRRGDAEWIVVFENGLKLDVLLAPIEPLSPINTAPYDGVLSYGVRVLFDKSAPELKRGFDREPPPAAPPAAAEFAQAVQRFGLDALRAAKFIRRGDLWRAKHEVDNVLKQHALVMLEWHALAVEPAQRVWHEGRWIAQWADRRAVAALPRLFASYDPIDLRRALFATLDLYRWVTQETAQRLGLSYSGRMVQRVTDWLAAIFED
jgi:aminoglycoside 6-adenylyltransferase